MAQKQIGFANFSGLAADTKPTTGIGAGSTFYETDTKKSFVYDGGAWHETGGSGALFQFNYMWKLAVDASPPTNYMSRDNATTASITKLYVNKVDATGHDMSLFLSEITAGDDLTLHDHNDSDIYIAFTVSAAVTLTGNAFTIPVTFVKQNGADFTDNESVNIHWVSESSGGASEKGGIAHSATTDYVVGDIVSVLKETYQCTTAHTAKAFDSADWLQIWNSEQSQDGPNAPPDISASPTQIEVQAVLDYAKEIVLKLGLAEVFMPALPLSPRITGFLVPGATSFNFESDSGEEFTVEQGGVIQTFTGTGSSQVVASIDDTSEITIVLTGANTYFKFKNDKWKSLNLRKIENILTLEESFIRLRAMETFECEADVSNIVNFGNAWEDCGGLTSFPTINPSSGTNFLKTWFNCLALKFFAFLNTSSGTNFMYAWYKCQGLTSFPKIDMTSYHELRDVWNGCIELVSFPEMDHSNTTMISRTWVSCSKLVCFEGELDFSAYSSGTNAFDRCHKLIAPAPIGTPVRGGTSSGNALNGTWTNPTIVDFSFIPTVLSVAFTDTTTSITPTSWHWDFGDGTVDTVQNPTHVYTQAGTYTITMMASDDTLASEIKKTITV